MALIIGTLFCGHRHTSDQGFVRMGRADALCTCRQAIQEWVVSTTFGKCQGQFTPFNEVCQAGASDTTNAWRKAAPQARVNQVFGSVGFAMPESGEHIQHSTANIADELGRVVLVCSEDAPDIASAGFGHELRNKGVGLEHGVCFLKVP